MARFYGTMQGQARGTVSRVGSPNSGVSAHIRGWDGGIKVSSSALGDTDIFSVYVSGGSNDDSTLAHVGNLLVKDGEISWSAIEGDTLKATQKIR